MKTKDLKALVTNSDVELRKVLVDKKLELEKVLLAISTGKEKNLKKGKNLRKEIAQVLTLINHKKLIEAEKK